MQDDKKKDKPVATEDTIISYNTQNSVANEEKTIKRQTGSIFGVPMQKGQTSFADNAEEQSKYSKTTIKY